MYTQDELNIIHAAQKIVAGKGTAVFIYSRSVSLDGEQFTKTFNPEDCECSESTYEGVDYYYPQTTVNGLEFTANLNKEAYDAWHRRWSE